MGKPLSKSDLISKLAEENVATYDRLINYYMELAEKYQKAVQAPWRSVAPDPPMPQ